jgi:hypothetical protein
MFPTKSNYLPSPTHSLTHTPTLPLTHTHHSLNPPPTHPLTHSHTQDKTSLRACACVSQRCVGLGRTPRHAMHPRRSKRGRKGRRSLLQARTPAGFLLHCPWHLPSGGIRGCEHATSFAPNRCEHARLATRLATCGLASCAKRHRCLEHTPCSCVWSELGPSCGVIEHLGVGT